MYEFLKHALDGQNQFASGGLLLMVIGGIRAFLPGVPKLFAIWLIQQSTMMITVSDDDRSFTWVKEWFLEQQFLRHIRRVDLDTSLRGTEMALIPAPGNHFFWRGRLPFWVAFHRSEETKGRSQRRIESLTFRTFGRKQAILRRFVDEVIVCHHNKRRMISYLYMYEDFWRDVGAYSPRLLDSVVLKPGEKEHLMRDLDQFRKSHDRYRRLGVPYHRGYLFYGLPGTGKTSLASALAANFGMSIYVANLTEFNDRTLKTAINHIPENSMILFEDIDCMKTGNRRDDVNDSQVKLLSTADTEKVIRPTDSGSLFPGC